MNTRLKVFGLILAVALAAGGLAFAIRAQNLRIAAQREAERIANETLTETPAVVTPTVPEPVSIPSFEGLKVVSSTDQGEYASPYPAVWYSDPTDSIRVRWFVAQGDSLLNGQMIYGSAVAFESQFSWKVEDADGGTIVSGYEIANQPDVGIPGPFEFPIYFDKVSPTPRGFLVLYEASAKDGTPIHVLRIPVTFSQETETVNVYFGNTVENPNAMDCSLVYPVKRIVPKGDESVAAHALLAGPTASEKRAGYYTSIPDGVVIQSTFTGEGSVDVDFSQTLQDSVGGSCRVEAIRSQILTTIAQGNAERDYINILIDGRTKDILQP
ncbi:MAG: GerMN domain-containing protein [Patescibacteria group bacterium]